MIYKEYKKSAKSVLSKAMNAIGLIQLCFGQIWNQNPIWTDYQKLEKTHNDPTHS